MASARSPLGSPPPSGPMICQNMEWLTWPPPLLRTAVRMPSGTAFRSLDQVFERLAFEVGALLERLVEVVHIRGMVLVVMDFHRLRVDVGFEGVVRIR